MEVLVVINCQATSPASIVQLIFVGKQIGNYTAKPFTFLFAIFFVVFIVVKGRNSIETWSKLPVTLGTPLIYDFAY